MTLLTTLNRIAPLATTAKRAFKPALSSAYAVAQQQRFNSNGAVEVRNRKGVDNRIHDIDMGIDDRA